MYVVCMYVYTQVSQIVTDINSPTEDGCIE